MLVACLPMCAFFLGLINLLIQALLINSQADEKKEEASSPPPDVPNDPENTDTK